MTASLGGPKEGAVPSHWLEENGDMLDELPIGRRHHFRPGCIFKLWHQTAACNNEREKKDELRLCNGRILGLAILGQKFTIPI